MPAFLLLMSLPISAFIAGRFGGQRKPSIPHIVVPVGQKKTVAQKPLTQFEIWKLVIISGGVLLAYKTIREVLA